ncbi:hypothetical protein [Mucilaginibacter lacusdianchii]|uniref:hypothetical protein n=1 Tax=Mucilaginibacter lacusdianchii TaxID=2684211 RepID=UPI00131CA9E7|nr:hypothetical protein [Mucilaginibacter sp. JXJ CY 39]
MRVVHVNTQLATNTVEKDIILFVEKQKQNLKAVYNRVKDQVIVPMHQPFTGFIA